MNKTLIGFLAFGVGTAVGSIATWYYFKTKYEVISDEEIPSDLESNTESVSDSNIVKEVNIEDQLKEYKEIIEKTDYSGYSRKSEEVQEEMDNHDKPYLISYDEFGNMEDWNEVQVTYYADDFLVDQDDEVITDAEDQFGYECLKEFDGNDKPDAIYVRNEALETDYEIVYDNAKYEDDYDYGMD